MFGAADAVRTAIRQHMVCSATRIPVNSPRLVVLEINQLERDRLAWERENPAEASIKRIFDEANRMHLILHAMERICAESEEMHPPIALKP